MGDAEETITPAEILADIGGWQALLPEDFNVEHGGQQIHVRDHPFVKEARDFGAFVKQAFDAHREVGSRVRIPGAEATDAERDVFRQKLIEAKLLEAPPASPEEYGIAKPETVPEGVTWDEGLAGELAKALHKHGAPKELAADLLALHMKALAGAGATLKTSFEAGMAALRREHGDQFEKKMDMAARLSRSIFRTPEEVEFFETTGLANHPGFINLLLRLAPLAEQDSSFMREYSHPGGQISGDEVRLEVAKIMSDKTHPMYEGYWRRDPKIMAHVEGLYRRAYGDTPVEVG